MGVPSINSSCMRLANSSCPKTRTEPKPRILEVFSKRNNVLEKDLAPPAQPLCLLFIHPRAPNLISLRSVLPPSSVGEMTLRLDGTLSYSGAEGILNLVEIGE